MNRQKLLGEEKISKLLMQFSVPAIIGMMVNTLYNIVDRMYIGNIPEVGGLALTGVGITMPIMTIILAFGMLVGIGCSKPLAIFRLKTSFTGFWTSSSRAEIGNNGHSQHFFV